MATSVNPLIAQLLYRNQLMPPAAQPETPQSQAVADAQQQAAPQPNAAAAQPLHRTPGMIAQAVAPASEPQPASTPASPGGGQKSPGPTPAAPANLQDAVHNGFYGQEIPMSREDFLKGYKPQHLQPEEYKGPGWGRRLLFGLAAAASGIGHPEIGYQMVSNYNNRNQEMEQQVADYNAKLPVLNQQADEAAYNQYLEGEATKARIADTGSQITNRGAQTGMQQDELNARLAGMGYRKNAQTGALEQIPENEMTPVQQAELQMTRAGIALRDAQTAASKAEVDPNSPQNKLAQENVKLREKEFAQTQARLQLAWRSEAFREGPGMQQRNAGNVLKVYQPALDADFRLKQMLDQAKEAKAGNQQAMLGLLYNHMGMTAGLQKGARMTQDMIKEAEQSRPWLQGMAATFSKDGVLTGVKLSPQQIDQMVQLAEQARPLAWERARSEAKSIGLAAEPQPLDGLPALPGAAGGAAQYQYTATDPQTGHRMGWNGSQWIDLGK